MTTRSLVADGAVWTRADFPQPRSWVRPLTPAMQDELVAAAAHARARGLDPHGLAPAAFPLPLAAPMLAEARRDLEEGRGFAVIGGFPVDRFEDYRGSLYAYCGLASYLGDITAQTVRGEKSVDVTDKGIPYSHQSRGYSSNKLLPFHTDGSDRVGLLCLETAMEGGLSILVSAPKVYNTILAERPDLMPIFERGFYHHRRGEQPAGEGPLSPGRVPVFSFHAGLLHCCYNRNPINWVEKEGITLTAEETAALDYFDSVTARPEMQLAMEMRKGDVQFVNNFVILHSRTEYMDAPGKKRHLLRLWLNDMTSRRVGPTLLDLYSPAHARRLAKAG